MYLATFDTAGKRITSYVVGIHKNIPADAVVITDEDQEKYASNLYYRGADGKPALIPATVKTAAELKSAEIAAIDAQYNALYADYQEKGQNAAYLGKTSAATAFKNKYNAAMALHLAAVQEVNTRYA